MALKRITSFTFPVGKKVLSQAASYRALSGAESGFYPFGKNGLWHGGIHIDEGVLRELNHNDKRQYCLANGEVVAYRVNQVYPKVTYDTEEISVPFVGNESVAYFSTGFTLVRHYLQMPKVPSESSSPYITLYSLYMHQLDDYGYQQCREASPHNPPQLPTFWHLHAGKVSETTQEWLKGSAIRIEGSKTTITGLLLKESKIKLGDELVRYDEAGQRTGRRWYKLVSLESGCIVTETGVHYTLDGIQGYVYAGELNEAIKTDSILHKETVYSIKTTPNDKVGIKERNVPGIVVYQEANSAHILGYLPHDARFEFDGQDNGYGKIIKVDCGYIPSSLNVSDDGEEEDSAIHHGWVKLSNLSDLSYRPKVLDKVVVLDKPVAINGGDFIGYLGHSVSRANQFVQREPFPLATMKRASDDALSLLGHIELFTCDDLPDFITKTRVLAEKLPESEKSLIVVEPGACLIGERPSDGVLPEGLHVNKIAHLGDSHYLQVRVNYRLKLNRYACQRDRIIPSTSLNDESSIVTYQLMAENKRALVRRYRFEYPELTEDNIPDEVELIGYTPFDGADEVTVQFHYFDDEVCWVKAEDIAYPFGGEDRLYQPLPYWTDFPLTLSPLPKASLNNTVYYARTLPLDSLRQDNLTATDDKGNLWASIRAGNQDGMPIQGWVSLAKGETGYCQPHIKRASPFEWIGFNVIEEKATTGEQLDKLSANRKMTLDLGDYTDAMSALHHILSQTPLNEQLPNALPPFTAKQLKDGLRTAWTAEQIGRLAIKYESEWYADSGLSKWDEMDVFYDQELEQKRQAIEAKLQQLSITRPVERKQAFKLLDQLYMQTKNEWQIEKAQRIKPSLWWSEVAQAQAAQSQSNPTENSCSPILSNLSPDGKAWYLHPVGMMGFDCSPYINGEGFIENSNVIKYQVNKLERGNIIRPNAIVLHRTFSKGSAINVIENTWESTSNTNYIGAHFVIDKDGKIYQVVSLKKYTNHVGKIRPRCQLTNNCDNTYKSKSFLQIHLDELVKNYPERYPYNKDSIGIEVVAWWDKETKLWDEATPEQLESISELIQFLQKEFNLNDQDLYQHQCIAYKTNGEGKNLYPPSDNWNIDSRFY